jgi:two-component system sensor histidine kinase BaeS
VIGNALLDRLSPSTPILVEGQAVGEILLARRPALSDAADLEFAKAQGRAMLWIALGVLALALPLSLWLARQMTKPLRALAQGARKLAAGELATRVSAARGDEVGDLTVDFNRLAETLERHRDLRRDWVADISHELRTPLSVLRGEIHALEDGVRPLDAAAVASLRVEADRLSALIEDLYQLSLSDLGALSYQFESIDLDRVLRDTLDAHQAAFAQQGLSAHVVTPRARECLVRADERRLAQLFGNLLVNAARYTDRPGRVEIVLASEGAHVVVHIDDTPPGVPTEALPRLFERFYRVESSRNRAAGGAGLGLAISRNIVEAHGGEITACASPLGGLRVSVRLPRATGSR